jgi:DnaK suppressor protein
MMPTKTKSSAAAKRKAKPVPSRPRNAGSAKVKSGTSKKTAPARAAKRTSAPAAKSRAASKPAPKAGSSHSSKRPPAPTAKQAPTPLKPAVPAAKPAPTARGKGKGKAGTTDGPPNNVRQLARAVAGIAPYEEAQGEEYMGEPQREHFRRILMQWKRDLMNEVDRTVHHMQDEAANFPDPNDRATQESEFSLELRARDRERKLIKKIDEALASVSSGDYGYCESCGVEIGIRRLEARPTATLCIDCKTLDEIREKQTGS